MEIVKRKGIDLVMLLFLSTTYAFYDEENE
jgi:hypothetical protein